MKTIGVLGTGTMGAGIIQVCAQKGFNVVLRARRQTSVDKGIATVEKNLDKLIKKEKITEADRLRSWEESRDQLTSRSSKMQTLS